MLFHVITVVSRLDSQNQHVVVALLVHTYIFMTEDTKNAVPATNSLLLSCSVAKPISPWLSLFHAGHFLLRNKGSNTSGLGVNLLVATALFLSVRDSVISTTYLPCL